MKNLKLKMNLEEKVKELLKKAMTKLGWPEVAIILESPKLKEHGDLSANAAFLLAKPLKKPPRQIAEELLKALQPLPDWVENIEVAGAGFLNFRLRSQAWFESLRTIFKEGEKFGTSSAGKNRKVILEFVSANPTGPLNVVSARAAAVGDTLANLLKATGHKVHREYYVNDIGNQIDLFAQSIQARVQEARGSPTPIPEGGYHGEYLKEFAAGLAEKKKNYTPADFKKMGLKEMVTRQKKSLEKFGVAFDRWFFQSELMEKGKLEKTLKRLEKLNHLYEQEGAIFFRAAFFGDEKDRVVRKADGEYTYFASDIAYHADKFDRKFDRAIDLLGPDHHGYVARTRAAMVPLGIDPQRLTVLIIQQVNLLEGDVQVKMSKRAGKIITLDALLNEVGRDVARYFFLQRAASTPLDFDLELAKKETPENPVFYIQYAHARICSIFKKAAAEKIKPNFKKVSLELLDLPEEKELAKKILQYPAAVASAAQELAPHTLAFYCHDLAQQFQAYYSQAKNDPRYRVVDPSRRAKTEAKLYLLKNIRIVIQNALRILGISAPERMEKDVAGAI